MDYITINEKVIPYPNKFKMEKEPNIVSELTTMNGNVVADINGWRFRDTTLQWDTLLDNDLRNLLDALADDVFTMTFKWIDGNEHTVTARKESRVATKTRLKRGGKTIWSDINVTLSFPECYH